MPYTDEVAELIVNDKIYSNWTSVSVELDWSTLTREVRFQAVEDINGRSTMAAMQIKPGDKCEVKLAGELVMIGYVYNRQASYNATQHGVMIVANSLTKDAVDSTVKMSDTEFKGYSFEAIAKKVLQPYGLKLVVKNPPPGFDKKFDSISAFPGETSFSFLERLSRMRGVFLHDDEKGNVVAEQLPPNQQAEASLQEGRNIMAANCTIDDQSMFSALVFYGQRQGSDSRWGTDASAIAAEGKGPSKRYREHHVAAEEQTEDTEDVKRRVTQERNARLGTSIVATITVQGWRKGPREKLWNFGQIVSVKSPMLLLDHDLGVRKVTFNQSSEAGTTTTLELCLPEFMSSMPGWSGRGEPGLLGNTDTEPKALTR